MNRLARTIPLLALVAIGHRALAQRPDSTFVPVRADGNGIAELQTTIRVGFNGQTSGNRVHAIATLARLNLTSTRGSRVSRHPLHRRASAAAAIVDRSRRGEPRARARVAERPDRGRRGLPLAPKAKVADTTSQRPVALPAVRTQARASSTRSSRRGDDRRRVDRRRRAARRRSSSSRTCCARCRRCPASRRAATTRRRSTCAAARPIKPHRIDGYPIYSPFHLGGVFSTFIDPTVGRVELRTAARQRASAAGSRACSTCSPPSRRRATCRHRGGVARLVDRVARPRVPRRRRVVDGRGAPNLRRRRGESVQARRLSVPLSGRAGPPRDSDRSGGVRLAASRRTTESTCARQQRQTRALGGVVGKSRRRRDAGEDVRDRRHLFGISFGDSIVARAACVAQRYDATSTLRRASVSRGDRSRVDARTGGSVAALSAAGHTRSATSCRGSALRTYAHGAREARRLVPVRFPGAAARTRRACTCDELWRPASSLLVEGGVRVDARERPGRGRCVARGCRSSIS